MKRKRAQFDSAPFKTFIWQCLCARTACIYRTRTIQRCGWKRENMLLWLLSLRTLPENSSALCENYKMELTKRMETSERAKRTFTIQMASGIGLTSAQINVFQFSACVRCIFYRIRRTVWLCMCALESNDFSNIRCRLTAIRETNGSNDVDFICLQFTLFTKWKMSVLIFLHQIKWSRICVFIFSGNVVAYTMDAKNLFACKHACPLV